VPSKTITTQALAFAPVSGTKPAFAEFLGRSFGDVNRYRGAILTFIANNLSKRYRRSTLGFLWSFLSPFMTMAVMAAVFALVFRAELKHFGLFIFSGSLPWMYMSDAAIEGSQCFLAGESYLKKLFIPKLFFPFVSVGTDTMNFVFSLTSLLLLTLALGVELKWTVCLLPGVIAITYLFNLGMALLFGVATVYLRDLTHITRVMFQSLFYLCPILYPLSMIPARYQPFFSLNPFYHFIKLFRLVVYEGQCPTSGDWITACMLSVSTLLLGLYVLMRKEREIIFRL